MRYNLTYKPYGERSILVEWPSIIDEKIIHNINEFKDEINKKLSKLIIEVSYAYNSLLVPYKSNELIFNDEVLKLKKIYGNLANSKKSAFNIWQIPVCYDDAFGLDLEALALTKKISKKDIIDLHTEPDYTVYFIGFLPGFLYLGGLHEMLHTPRKQTPRLVVQKGAVAIGGNQTGVYPQESPGGWNIIGNSPISFFNVSKKTPCFAKSGDKIKFYSVSKKEYDDIKVLVDAGVYQLESEVVND